MKSMTAFAQVSALIKGKKYRLELQSLNKKGLDIQVDLPYAFSHLNIPLRLFFSKKIERGTLFFRLKEELSEKAIISKDDLINVKSNLVELAHACGFSTDAITFSMVLDKVSSFNSQEIALEDIEPCLDTLVASLVCMREDEGMRLKKDFLSRMALIESVIAEIEQIQSGSSIHVKDKLLERLSALSLTQIDEDRLAKEVVYYVEKQDVTEEITRLKSHIKQFHKLLDETQATGRKLEFLVQECFREVNTLASKTSELDAVNATLILKNEFEKIKEQIMNIE